MNVYQKINRVMAEVAVIAKEDKKVNNQYEYLSHDAVVRGIRAAMVKEGIVTTLVSTVVNQNGNRTELEAVFRFVNVDKPDDFVDVCSFGYGIDGQDKGPGKAISYAKKYALLTTFLLEAGDSADVERHNVNHRPATTPTAKQAPAPTPKPQKLTVGKVKKLFMAEAETKADAASLWKHACEQVDADASKPTQAQLITLDAWLKNSFGSPAEPQSTHAELRNKLLGEHLPAYKRRE